MIKIALGGVAGRVGISIFKILLERKHTLVAAFEAPGSALIGKPAGQLVLRDDVTRTIEVFNLPALANADGIIDFSSPDSTMTMLDGAVESGKPIVIGTTGLSGSQVQAVSDAAKTIPVLFSPNMSVGVNLLFKLTAIASEILGNNYDIELLEAHHRYKKDAPSGTAKKLAEIIKSRVDALNGPAEVYDRSKIIGERNKNEIGISVVRGGDIVGEHTVFFIGNGERIELTHRATSRDTFALGAVMGLEFIVKKSPGLYTMTDVLGF